MRKRQQKGPRVHYLIAVNKNAANFSDKAVRQLTGAIRRQNGYYTVMEPDSPENLQSRAREFCRLKRRSSPFPPPVARRGKVTGIIAAGGDGTVNAAARVAVEANLPLGILPLGRFNDIAWSLCNGPDIRKAIKAIINRQYRPIDVALVGRHIIVGSMNAGFLGHLRQAFGTRKRPRFAFRWTSIASSAAARSERVPVVAKVDAFRFEIEPRMFSVNLLPRTLGLDISPASIPDDKQGEIVFDVDCTEKDLGRYVRDVYKGKYVYGSEVRLYRGAYMQFTFSQKPTVVIDGDQVELDSKEIEIHFGEKRLKIFC